MGTLHAVAVILAVVFLLLAALGVIADFAERVALRRLK